MGRRDRAYYLRRNAEGTPPSVDVELIESRVRMRPTSSLIGARRLSGATGRLTLSGTQDAQNRFTETICRVR